VGGARVSFAVMDGGRPLRGVVVGAGFLGPFWVRELLAGPDTEIVGWVDVDEARVRGRRDELRLGAVPRSRSRRRWTTRVRWSRRRNARSGC
jgi:hypothetical protein